jgi:hypothetical protein
MNAVLMRLKRRLTFANVTSAAALFVALGGTSYAAISLPADSVGTREIRTGGVGKSEVQTGGVGQSEIRTGAVGKGEIRTGGVGASELHTDAVRKAEIRTDAVGGEEIAKDAVTTDEIKDGSVGMADLDDATRGALTPFRADVNANGGADGGNAKAITHTAGSGVYTVDFGSDVTKCTAVATLADVDAANAGPVTVTPAATSTAVTVHTYKPGTTADPTPVPADAPFHVVLGC